MLQSFLLLLGCLAALAWFADRFVLGAVGIANHTQLPPLWVGTVLVGLATTLPECLVSFSALKAGHVGLSLGNALGSYVANIGLVLGLTAWLVPLPVHLSLLRREMPALTIMVLLLVACLADCVLNVTDGWLLLVTLVGFLSVLTYVVVREKKKDWLPKQPPLPTLTMRVAVGWFVVGAVGLWLSAKGLVVIAMRLAQYWGVSDWLMGVTVVAVGTSLPELAASVASARKQQYDLAIGNVIGSNIFGILGVVALPALFAPGPVPQSIVWRDLTAIVVMTGLLWMMVLRFNQPIARIERREGAILFFAFLVYLTVVVIK